MSLARDLARDLRPLGERVKRWFSQLKRLPGRTDQRLMRDYAPASRKLHLGCGDSVLDGWLNTDFSPQSRDVMTLNATRRFPFDDESFDYVFSEHMIEHLRLTDGLKMLAECFRVLRPGGRVRISTPDLRFLIELEGKRSEVQERYMEWSAATFLPHITGFAGEALVINNYMRDWGHQFIYDERTLREALMSCGFCDAVRYDLNESADVNLRDLENESRMPEGFLALETMTLEARKP